MNLQFFGGRGSSSGKGSAGASPVIEPLNENSHVSIFMKKLLNRYDEKWTKIIEKEDTNFIIMSKPILNASEINSGRSFRQDLRTTFLSAAYKERIANSIEFANKIINNPHTSAEYKNIARQWKNYLENYKKK